MDDVVKFLAAHRWLYDFKLTRIFLDRVWESAPEEWLPVFNTLTLQQLNELPYGYIEDFWPETFKKFVKKSILYSIERDQDVRYKTSRSDVSSLDVGMSEKKIHEVMHMARLVDQVTHMSDCDGIVDVGSGLGYLGQELHTKYRRKVLGLESKNCHTTAADKRAAKIESCPYLQNVTCELGVDEESQQQLISLVQDWWKGLPPGHVPCCNHSLSTPDVTNSSNMKHILHSTNSNMAHTHTSSCSSNKGKVHRSSRSKDSVYYISSNTYESNENILSSGSMDEVDTRTMAIKSKVTVKPDDLNTTADYIDINQVHAPGKYAGEADNNHVPTARAYEEDTVHAIRTGTGEIDHDHETRTESSEIDLDHVPRTESSELYIGHITRTGADELDIAHVTRTGNGKLDIGHLTRTEADGIDHADVTGTGNCELDIGHVTRTGDGGVDHVDVTGTLAGEIDIGHATRTGDCAVDIADVTRKGTGKIDISHVTGTGSREIGIGHASISANINRRCKEDAALDSRRTIYNTTISDTHGSPRICLVGLHCCGDLTPAMLHAYVRMPNVRALSCVSCCYHRMALVDGASSQFPLSEELRRCVVNVHAEFPDFQLTTFFLRLAAQETRARWRKQNSADHQFHMYNVAYRAILEICLETGKFMLKKTARKLAHKSDFSSFQTYIQAVYRHIVSDHFSSASETKEQFERDMSSLHDQYYQYFYLIQPITAMQFLLQPVIETLIHRDRQAWLMQHGYHSNLVTVFNECLSPRNIALVAIKPK